LRVVVLGAGVVGVTSAWYLAEAGHEVTVVERQAEAARETSFANGGQISVGHAEHRAHPGVLPKIVKWLGREDAPMLFRPRASLAQWEWGIRFLFECLPGRFERNTRELAGLALFSRVCLIELRQRTGIDYHSSQHGILHFCTDEQEFEALARHADAMRRLGVTREIKTSAECMELEPALSSSTVGIVGGAHTPKDESGDAFEFVQGLARLAQARGVRFCYGTIVRAIESAGDRVIGVRVSGPGTERIESDCYVVALGSYSPLLCAPLGVRMPVYPLKGYSITIALTPEQEPVAPEVSLTDEECKIVVSRFGNRLRAAGTAELGGYETDVNSVRCNAILERIRQLFPRLAPFGEVTPWAGLRPATPNNVPLIGATKLRNLFLNTGHGTLGWTLACGSGRALADLVSGRRPEVNFNFQ
jgi:D-amino-acid dehydrogenase